MFAERVDAAVLFGRVEAQPARLQIPFHEALPFQMAPDALADLAHEDLELGLEGGTHPAEMGLAVEVTCFGVPSVVVRGFESAQALAEALFDARFRRRSSVELAPGLWPAQRAGEFLAVAEDLMMAQAPTAGLTDLFTVGIGRDDLGVAASTDGAVFVSLREDSAAAVLAAIRDEIATGRWPGGGAHDRWLRQWRAALEHLLRRGCCVFGHVG